jgi:hypothetical protein
MMERRPFQSFGPKVTYQPGGEFYAQLPYSVLEKLLPGLKALIESFGGFTQTDITRRAFLDLLPEELRGLSKRTITNWWRRFVDLGLISRKREERSNVWTMTWEFPWLAGPVAINPAVGRPAVPAPTANEPGAAPQDDPAIAKWAIEFCEGKGWRIILEGDMLRLDPILEMEQEELSRDFRTCIGGKYRAAILAFLKGTHQRE